jgi:predicted ATP-grasp superfamily ATP-dependent carboligase
MPPITVLVTDPEQRAALATVRALGAEGFRIVVIGRGAGLAGKSRYVSAIDIVQEENATRPDGLLQAVAASVRRHNVDVVVPVTDTASRSLLGFESQVHATVAGPTRDAYLLASDKQAVLAIAPQCGISVPRQFILDSPDYDRAAVGQLGAMVAKPANSVVEVHGRSVNTQVRYVPASDELDAVLKLYPPGAYPILLQERVHGMGVGVFLLRAGGRTELVFGHRRLREKPPAGGVSTYREAVLPPPELVLACEQLLDTLGYEGAAMIEFKQDAASGAFVLMEINARLWGSVQLAIDAGVNFPVALVRRALGLPISPVAGIREGMRNMWELGEIDHMLALLRRSHGELHLPTSVPIGLRGALRALFDRRLGDTPEVFRWRDPMPFVSECARWLTRTS